MTHDDEDDDDEEDGFFDRDQRGPFDDTWRFGFSVSPDSMRFHGPPEFGQIFREMEEIFSQFGHVGVNQPLKLVNEGILNTWSKICRIFLGVPALQPHQDKGKGDKQGSSGNPLRDFMLKYPDSDSQRPRQPPREPRHDAHPSEKSPVSPHSPFHDWNSFSQV